MFHNVLCILNAAEARSHTSLDNCIDEESLVTPAVVPAVGSLASNAEHFLERGAIEQQPTFDMRVGNRLDNRLRNILSKGIQFPCSSC